MTGDRPLVVCIGHLTADLVTLVDRPPRDDELIHAREGVLASGGPAATAAVALARLGVATAFLGTVGDDEAGRLAVSSLAREGVDTSGIRIGDGPTAVSAIWVDAQTGHRSISAFYGAAGIDELRAQDLDLARSAAWVHLDSPGFRMARPLRQAGIRTPISLDAGNPVPDLDLGLVRLYAPTERRLLEEFGEPLNAAMAAALRAGPDLVVTTRGERGSIAARRPVGDEGEPLELVDEAAFEVPVRSTLGAGDVFHGALLASLVRGLDLRPALTVANAVAALSCRALDGRSAIPSWSEALAFAAASGRPVAEPVGRQARPSTEAP